MRKSSEMYYAESSEPTSIIVDWFMFTYDSIML